MKKKIGFILAGLAFSKEALAIAAAASVTAIALAPAFGFDPWTWVLGAAGGTITQAFLPADKGCAEPANKFSSFLSWIHGRRMHMAVIFGSIILAGVGSEYVVRIFTDQKWTVPNIYAAAFLLALCWPYAAHLAWKKLLKWSET